MNEGGYQAGDAVLMIGRSLSEIIAEMVLLVFHQPGNVEQNPMSED